MGYLFCYCVHKIKILLIRFLANANFFKDPLNYEPIFFQIFYLLVCSTWNWDLSQKFPKAAFVETSYHSWSFILIVHRLHGRLVVLSLGRSCSLCNAFKSHSSCGISGKVAIYSCYVLYKQTGTFVNNFWLYIGISFSVKKPILKWFTLNYPRHYHALW